MKHLLMFSFAALVLLMSACAGSVAGNNATAESASISATAPEGNGEVVIYVTRHGRTLFNTMGRAQGWADTPLTAEGILVAQDLGRGLRDVKFDMVISSDLTRSRQTARLVMEQNRVSDKSLMFLESDMLREACYGSYEGDMNSNMLAAFAKEGGYTDFKDFATKTGKALWETSADLIKRIDKSGMAEDGATIKARMQTKLKEVAEAQAAKGGGNVLLVAHGMSINIMISDMTPDYTAEDLKNASVTKIIYKNGVFTVESINDISYIEAGAKLR